MKGPKEWSEVEGLGCNKCPGVLDRVGRTIGKGAGVPIYQCQSCLEIASESLEEAGIIVGFMIRGQAYRVVEGKPIAVDHPDDVWG